MIDTDECIRTIPSAICIAILCKYRITSPISLFFPFDICSFIVFNALNKSFAPILTVDTSFVRSIHIRALCRYLDDNRSLNKYEFHSTSVHSNNRLHWSSFLTAIAQFSKCARFTVLKISTIGDFCSIYLNMYNHFDRIV